MTQHTFKSASKRYWRAFVPVMALYLIIVLAGSFYLKSLDFEPRWLQVVIALASALPMIAYLFVQLRYFEETDEYNRAIQFKGFAYGGAITIGAIFIIGFLQMFEAIGYVEVFWFGPFFFIAYGLCTYLLGGRQCL